MNVHLSLRVFGRCAAAGSLAALTACGHTAYPTTIPQTALSPETSLDNAFAPDVQSAPKPAIYIANTQSNSIAVFPESANGNVAPAAKIAGSATALHGPLAVLVAPNGRIYAANATNTIEIFRAGASGNVAPMTTIMCGGLNKPSALALDAAGTLYVANASGNSVSIFASSASGCVSGNRVIAGASTQLHTPMGAAFASGKIFVANAATNSIVSFAASAHGNVAPSTTLAGTLTKLNQPHGLAFDVHSVLYARNATSLTEYAAGAHGNVAPVRTIIGASTSLVRTAATGASIMGRAIVLDASRAIDTYAAGANGNVAPAQRITGSNTGLTGSSGLAIFEPVQIVGVNLFGTSATTDPHYGAVHGYFNGASSTVSQVVHVTAGDPVVFKNTDGTEHTASFLGNATATSASYPASFNGSAAMSAAGSAIGGLHFSTGTLNAGQTSAMYFAAPGFYI